LPNRAPSPCNQPGCPKLTTGRYCSAHQQEANRLDALRRGTAAERGYGSRWGRYSRQYRNEHPVCMSCHRKRSEHTDHIKPVSGPDDPNFWEPTNHQALCQTCHSRKTALEDKRGLFNPPQTVFSREINGKTGLPLPWFL